jgi:hypothetical protein
VATIEVAQRRAPLTPDRAALAADRLANFTPCCTCGGEHTYAAQLAARKLSELLGEHEVLTIKRGRRRG